ncbi:testis-expressed protein 47 isoform X1 [Perca flavescens]|uniref:testis-expressed protein 47 isoform X1 n=1 Tax=Perca flavescens TaxID=8167 RepID=UPI00106E6784|nr:testis-expressed protein 47 isoform X1 [Perca flavescens]
MATSQKIKSFSWGRGDSEDEESSRMTMFDVLHGEMREKIVLQRLIVIARLPRGLADRTELGGQPAITFRATRTESTTAQCKIIAIPLTRSLYSSQLSNHPYYEKLNFQLSKQYIWDHMTGLLLIYPSCLLHIIESSREVLVSVLKDLKDMQQQPDSTLLEAAKVVFMAHNPPSRLFQQWSYKVLDADQGAEDSVTKGPDEEEESTETLVCTVLSALQKLGEHLKISKAVPGSGLDTSPGPIVSQEVLNKLLAREELMTPQQHLQMYNSPLHISMDFGQVMRSSCLTTV